MSPTVYPITEKKQAGSPLQAIPNSPSNPYLPLHYLPIIRHCEESRCFLRRGDVAISFNCSPPNGWGLKVVLRLAISRTALQNLHSPVRIWVASVQGGLY